MWDAVRLSGASAGSLAPEFSLNPARRSKGRRQNGCLMALAFAESLGVGPCCWQPPLAEASCLSISFEDMGWRAPRRAETSMDGGGSHPATDTAPFVADGAAPQARKDAPITNAAA